MAATFPASVVTPERVLLEDEDVEAVVLRTDAGDVTFLAHHSDLVGSVAPGVCRLQRADGNEQRVAVHGGFVQVGDNRVTVLAPLAELAEEIDVERARRALEAAEQRLAELRGAGASDEAGTDSDAGDAADAAERARVRIEVAGD